MKKNNKLKNIKILSIGIFFIAISTNFSIGNNLETLIIEDTVQQIDGLYYLRGVDPQDLGDEGTLLRNAPTENEYTSCGAWIQLQFAEEDNYTEVYAINNMYFHFWQRNFIALPVFELGYNTESYHSPGMNESISVDTSDCITIVDDFRLVQAMQFPDTEIAVFEGNEIYDFTIKYAGMAPFMRCNPNQYSFVILNLEDNETLLQYDRDNDHLNDYDELWVYFTNPFDGDTDDDGASDYEEVTGEDHGYWNSDPNDFDDSTDYRQIDPDHSFVELTNENYGGLSTCPAGDGVIYQHLKVTCNNEFGDPIQGIPPDSFDITVYPTNDANWYGNLSCSFMAVDNQTNSDGEIGFEIRGDTSIAGPIHIRVSVDNILFHDVDELQCNSFDLDIDGDVDLTDLVNFSSLFGTDDWHADYNWNGIVDLPDFVLFSQHFNH